jgi:addiction module RelE/StbE family toxin
VFKEKFHPKVKKDLKRLDKSLISKIPTHLDRILENPYQNSQLKDNLSSVYSYHFRENRVEYRIAYTINEDNEVVIILLIGSRENFYREVFKRL